MLEQLAEQGITQQQVARRLNVPASYLSDVKLGRKTLSDTFARFFCAEFGVGLDWLLDGVGPQAKPQLASQPVAGTSGQVMLPILSELIQGDPQDFPAWDGSRVEVAGAAAARAKRAHQPYVVRSPINDRLGRIQQNDLLLIDQNASELASVVVLLDRQQLTLVRPTEGGYQAVESGRAIRTKASPVGVCVGIVWAHF
jgi:transcriptional regulator with XRE-family HTH domain